MNGICMKRSEEETTGYWRYMKINIIVWKPKPGEDCSGGSVERGFSFSPHKGNWASPPAPTRSPVPVWLSHQGRHRDLCYRKTNNPDHLLPDTPCFPGTVAGLSSDDRNLPVCKAQNIYTPALTGKVCQLLLYTSICLSSGTISPELVF